MPKTSPLSSPGVLRARWYLQVEKHGMSVEEVCRIFGISRKTYYKWYNRDHGFESRKYVNRKVHPAQKLTPRIKLAIYQAKEAYNYGPEKMRLYVKERFGISVSAVALALGGGTFLETVLSISSSPD